MAESSFFCSCRLCISHAILVSGESEASKTESTKMLMCYLAYMGGRTGTEGRSVEQKALESNPVLEAFGNAKTIRNNNSRFETVLGFLLHSLYHCKFCLQLSGFCKCNLFGKFVELQFDEMGRILWAAVRTYLPERSHV